MARRIERLGEFYHAFLHSAKPQTVSEIAKKLGMHQSIGQRIMQSMLRHKQAILYDDEKKPNNKKFYGPTPACFFPAFVHSEEELRRSGKEMKIKKVKTPNIKYFRKEYETLFEMWSKHDKFLVEVHKVIEKEGYADIKEYKTAEKFKIVMWLRVQTEYEAAKDDMPLQYQFLIGKEILREKDPEFVNAMESGSEIIEYEGWAGD